jgi:hypothetical protein
MPHTPAAQTAPPFCGTAHPLPHLPQFAGLVAVATQAEEHDVVPAGHTLTHFEFEQASSTPQTTLQPPQCFGLLDVSTQAPLQLAKPALQTKPHVASAHEGVAKAGAVQAWPQAPQLVESATVLTHAPPQATSFASQTAPHLPALQMPSPPAGAEHAVVHVLQ